MCEEWQHIKSELKKSLSKGQYDLWVSTVDFIDQKEDRLILACRNRFHIEWLREKLQPRLLSVSRQYFPQVKKLEYQIASADDLKVTVENQELDVPLQMSFSDLIRRPGPKFNPKFTFDQFVVGQCNQFAYAASMAMANGQQFFDQSVYLLSETGLGKSHLSHAIGNHLLSQKPDLRVQYLTTEQFANEMIYALRNDKIDAFKNKFRSGCDILLLERIEFLSGKEKIQNELIYTLDELLDRGKKVLCTGSSYPKDIPKINSELKSRLGGLMLAPIERPDFQTRMEIIKRKAQIENVKVPMDVVEFLADRITSDVRQLESCLVGLVAKTNIMGVPISLNVARDITQTLLDRLPKITIDHVQKVVCESYQVSVADLQSASRRKQLALARKVAMYLCRQYTSESLATIGKSFKRSHSSVVYAVNGLNKEMVEKNSKLKRQVEYLSRRLETSCLSSR
ncbi:chromosomal replication initiator protein DnaA [Desulfoferrobacter suflitae]|uniref:chromosomal replication initiator protein DnaA n=1 Tax=Desulfoferrobacter suflitae TaxID=2865782 RepID=UPI002164DECF|nr:chromosomal replication initiator protein DnaA [Desulfoferrobacter suflitae]MCK8602060.1 chromosomal replication initiator protein DnaA [Desulfoferrobacter suflitae]